MPQALLFVSVTYKKMRLVARISSDQVSSKTDVTTSSYEGFKFCIDPAPPPPACLAMIRHPYLHETQEDPTPGTFVSVAILINQIAHI